MSSTWPKWRVASREHTFERASETSLLNSRAKTRHRRMSPRVSVAVHSRAGSRGAAARPLLPHDRHHHDRHRTRTRSPGLDLHSSEAKGAAEKEMRSAVKTTRRSLVRLQGRPSETLSLPCSLHTDGDSPASRCWRDVMQPACRRAECREISLTLTLVCSFALHLKLWFS